MKRILYIIIMCLPILCLSCKNHNYKINRSEILYTGSSYDVIKLNDSTALAIPGVNTQEGDKPYLINLKNIEIQ